MAKIDKIGIALFFGWVVFLLVYLLLHRAFPQIDSMGNEIPLLNIPTSTRMDPILPLVGKDTCYEVGRSGEGLTLICGNSFKKAFKKMFDLGPWDTLDQCEVTSHGRFECTVMSRLHSEEGIPYPLIPKYSQTFIGIEPKIKQTGSASLTPIFVHHTPIGDNPDTSNNQWGKLISPTPIPSSGRKILK